MSPLSIGISMLEGRLSPGREQPQPSYPPPALTSPSQGPRPPPILFSSWACISPGDSVTHSQAYTDSPQSPKAELTSKHCRASSPQQGQPILPTASLAYSSLSFPFFSPAGPAYHSLPLLCASPVNSQANLYPIPERLGESRSPPNLPAM